MFPCTPLVYFARALCSFFIYILLFTDKKKKKSNLFVDSTISSTQVANCSNSNGGSSPIDCTGKSNSRGIVEWSLEKFPDAWNKLMRN